MKIFLANWFHTPSQRASFRGFEKGNWVKDVLSQTWKYSKAHQSDELGGWTEKFLRAWRSVRSHHSQLSSKAEVDITCRQLQTTIWLDESSLSSRLAFKTFPFFSQQPKLASAMTSTVGAPSANDFNFHPKAAERIAIKIPIICEHQHWWKYFLLITRN